MLDAFHVVRLGFAAVDDVRRRIQQEQTWVPRPPRGPALRHPPVAAPPPRPPLRALLGRAARRLDAGDTADEQLARTWVAAQDLRLIYQARDRPAPQRPSTAGWPTAPMRHPRAHPPGPHNRLLAVRAAGLLRHRRRRPAVVEWPALWPLVAEQALGTAAQPHLKSDHEAFPGKSAMRTHHRGGPHPAAGLVRAGPSMVGGLVRARASSQMCVWIYSRVRLYLG